MRTVVTGEAVELELPPASVLARGASVLIDLLLYAVVLFITMLLFGLTADNAPVTLDDALYATLTLSTMVGCFVALPVAIETLSRGRSPGRMLLGIRIVRDDGGSVRFRHALIRGLIGFGEFFLTMGLLPVVSSMLHPRGKRVGDMVAGTYGILVRQPKVKPMMLPVPQHLQSWTQIADLGRVPDGLAVRIGRLLRSLESRDDGAPAPAIHQTAAQLAGELSGHVSPPPPPCSAVEFLTAVMAERRNREYRRLRRQQQRQETLGQRLHWLPYS